MSQQTPDNINGRSAFQHVCCKTMPERMSPAVLGDALLFFGLMIDLTDESSVNAFVWI